MTDLGPQASDRDLHHIATLLNQAHKLKGDSSEKSAHITQFLSPLAFNNPLQSKDRAMSNLIGHFITTHGGKLGEYEIIKKELVDGSHTDLLSDSGLTRKFQIQYRKGSGSVQTVILTEHAPDYRNGQMSTDAITKALNAIGDADPDVMLSYLGVGRVAIMQVVLDVQARIKMRGPERSSGDRTIEQMLDEAIEKVEAVRGSYISRKPAQKDAILEVLRNYVPKWDKDIAAAAKAAVPAAEIKAPIAVPAVARGVGFADPVDSSADVSRSNTPDPSPTAAKSAAAVDPQSVTPSPGQTVPAPDTTTSNVTADAAPPPAVPAAGPATVDTATPAAGPAAPASVPATVDTAPPPAGPIAAQVSAPSATESPAQSGQIIPALHVPLAPVPLTNLGNTCYANSAFKFMHCWLGDHFKVHPDISKGKDGKEAESFSDLRKELQKIVDKLKAPTVEPPEESLLEFTEALTSGKLPILQSDLPRFKPGRPEDASEFVTAVKEAIGVNNINEDFNSPYFKVKKSVSHGIKMTNGIETKAPKLQSDGETTYVWTEWKGTPIEWDDSVPKLGPQLQQVKGDVVSGVPVFKEMNAWVQDSLKSSDSPIEEFKLGASLVDDSAKGGGLQVTDEVRERILKDAGTFETGLRLTKLTEHKTLCIADAKKPSKLALNLVTYYNENGDPNRRADRKVFDLDPINLNQEIELTVYCEDKGCDKTIKYKPTAFVFHYGNIMEDGHYFMVAKEPPAKGGKWVKHSDHTITTLTDTQAAAFTSNAARTGARPTLVLLQSTDSLGKDAPQPTGRAAPPKAPAFFERLPGQRPRNAHSNPSRANANKTDDAAAPQQRPVVQPPTRKGRLNRMFKRNP
ncbi:MAG: hypothetical protein QE278_12720 [Limnobacter sp.]|nr:hypothetical protein [Limnobacter sp.]